MYPLLFFRYYLGETNGDTLYRNCVRGSILNNPEFSNGLKYIYLNKHVDISLNARVIKKTKIPILASISGFFVDVFNQLVKDSTKS